MRKVLGERQVEKMLRLPLELIDGEGKKRLIIRLENIGVGLEVEVDAKYLRKQKK